MWIIQQGSNNTIRIVVLYVQYIVIYNEYYNVVYWITHQ